MSTSSYVALGVAIGAACLGFAAGCANPVESDRVAALPPDTSGQRNGPLHRPGQPCLVCHADGGQARAFSLAGTVYATVRDAVPVDQVLVTIVDAAGHTIKKRSNCAGNFYVQADEVTVTYPLHVEIECTLPDGSTKRSVMGTRVDREGSCSTCHFGDPSKVSPGRVGCTVDMPNPPYEAPATCTDQGGRG